MVSEENVMKQEFPVEPMNHREFPSASPAKLLVKFSADGDRRYVAGELERDCPSLDEALDLYDKIRERYRDEIGPSALETFFRGMTLEKVVDSFAEETAAAMPFPLAKVKDESYVGKTVGEVFMAEEGLVNWVQKKIKYDEESDITKKLGIAACVWYFTDREGEF